MTIMNESVLPRDVFCRKRDLYALNSPNKLLPKRDRPHSAASSAFLTSVKV